MRNAVEILWPLMLFLILVLVRHKRPAVLEKTVTFRPQGMPSAGLVPFMQGFFCDFYEYRGTPYEANKTEDLPNNKVLFEIIQDLQIYLQTQGSLSNQTDASDPSVSLFLRRPETVRQFLIQNMSFSPSLVDSFLDAKVNMSEFNNRGRNFYISLLTPLFISNFDQTYVYDNVQSICHNSSWKNYLTFSSPENETAFKEVVCNLSRSQVNEASAEFMSQIKLPTSLITLANTIRDDGGLYRVFCGKKRVKQKSADDGRLVIKPDELKEEGKQGNGFKKDSCAWLREHVKGNFEIRNYTDNRKCSAVKPELRTDCGWSGIGRTKCQQLGCCHDDSIPGSFYCFCPASGTYYKNDKPCRLRAFLRLRQPNSVKLCGSYLPLNTIKFPDVTWHSTPCQFTRKFPTDDRCCMFRGCLLDNVAIRDENGEISAVFAQMMRQFLSARILYTPDNDHTRRIIEKANFTFAEMGYVWNQIRTLSKNMIDRQPRLNTFDSPNFITLRILASVYGFDLNDRGSGFNNQFQSYVQLIAEFGDCLSFDYFRAVKDERTVEKIAMSDIGFPPIASLVFTNVPDDSQEFPSNVEYKIRQDIDFVRNTRALRKRYWQPGASNVLYRLGYKLFGFVLLQDMIDRGITDVLTNETVEKPGLFLQMMPYPCYIYDQFVYTISNSMPLFMTLAWIYSVGMIIKTIVYEKEMRLKEVMKVMGLTNATHWVAWFITSITMMMVTTVLLVFVFKYGQILHYSDPLLIFVFLSVFTVSTIMFCFMISVFFSRANVAAACGGLIYLTTYLPYVMLTIYEDHVTKSHLIAGSLLSPTAFGIACRYFARYEEQGVGVQWSNLNSSPVSGDEFSVGGAMFMLIIDTIIYGTLTWYIEAVFPGDYGVPKPWYFPFMKSYWCSPKAIQPNSDQDYRALGDQDLEMETVDLGDTPTDPSVITEREPKHLPLGISMKNLVKVYHNGKTAVDDLSLNLYAGQITSFLGHNGAGKTTTMSLLTGIYPPTSGTAYIGGKDIRSRMDDIRSSLGICPQYNVLFDDLTVEEHLWFYAQLKGMKKSLVQDEIEKFLADSQLVNKRKERSRFLSGGMKRKLSVSMAFVAGSKTVILDEPTAGVDPYARRAIWDLLLQYKPGRTILLSTHHMDEADVLGDRIAIIAQGKLRCCGTSLFLKNQYGTGYYLTLVKKELAKNVRRQTSNDPSNGRRLSDEDSENQSETSSRSIDEGVSLGDSSSEVGEAATESDSQLAPLSLSAFIKSYVAQAQLVESVGTEMTYVLPTGESHGSKFENLFDALNQNLERFNISSFGVSDTTLEEVFLNVASTGSIEEEEEVKSSYPSRRSSFRNEKCKFERVKKMFQKKQRKREPAPPDEFDGVGASGSVIIEEDEDEIDDVFSAPKIQTKDKGLTLIKKQFVAMLKKRFSHAKRNRKGFISQIVLPALFVCLAMVSSMLRPPIGDIPSLRLTTTDAVPQPNNVFFADARKSSPGKRLADTFVNPPGIGSYCITNNCSRKTLAFYDGFESVPKTAPTFLQSCSCATGTSVCSDNCCKYPPPMAASDTGDTVLNVTTRDINDYLLRTNKEFRKKRYGGVTFGHKVKIPIGIRRNADPNVRRLFTSEGIKAWYNNKGFHAMPTFLSVASNTLLRERIAAQGKDPRRYGITTYNHPINLTKGELSEATLKSMTRTDLVMAIFVIFALAFVPASFVVFLINERVTKAKHLHMVCGVNPLIYWVSNLAWDMCNYAIPALCCICIFLAFQEKSYTSSDNFAPTLLLLMLYGWSITPLMYPASFFFEISSTAYIALICINLFVGMNTTIATFVLEFFDDDVELQVVNAFLKKIFLIFPNYCLGRGLIDLAKNQIFADVYKRFGVDMFRDPFSWDIVGRNITAMFIQGFVYFALTLLIEYKFFYRRKKVLGSVGSAEDEDDDVNDERQRVINGYADTECLRLVNLTKVYQSKFGRKNVAVKKLCLGVPKGQCFGLLGVNGAGKTTTFKMLTGDIAVTKGDAYINSRSIDDDIMSARQSMGYCPQFDALNDLLTAREHLKLYARIRGIQEEDLNQVTDWCLRTLNLLQYADCCAGKYSGGNKRKLSTAIALVGECPIIFLDEPTTGMDPKARRFLWKVISDIVKDGRTIILTSHSMEECEALCGRIAIMVNGEFKCMGTPQHLKNKFGDGYTVILRIAGVMPDLEPVKIFMENTFLECVLKDQHHNMLEYQLHNEKTSLSFVFGELERNRGLLKIEEYSVSQTTLDQVFINFAKQQTDGIETSEPEQTDEDNVYVENNAIPLQSPTSAVDV